MSVYKQVTNRLNVQAAESFISSIQNESAYYVFAAKHTPYSGSSDNIVQPTDTEDSIVQVYNDMLFGKKVKTDDVKLMIKRNTWKTGMVYAMYDDNVDLQSEDFFVLAGTPVEYRVYKCLYRPTNPDGTGVPSTQEPTGKELFPVEYPQDGYIWKYMYSISDFDMARFATQDYVPIIPDSEVIGSAVGGTIDVITVDQTGYGYNNYVTGSIPTQLDIAIDNNPLQYGLDSSASTTNGFYDNCLMKMTSGSASNQYRLITRYYVKNGRRIVVLDRPFQTTIYSGDSYEIYPNVFVYDTLGSSTANCVARAIINTENNANSISKIEVLNPGAGYRRAKAVIIPGNSVVASTNVVIRPVVSPPNGHGSSPQNELYGHYVGITSSFIGNNTPLTANNDYRTIGLLRDPLYANVNIKLDVTDIRGAFIPGETVYRYKPIKLYGDVNVSANSLVSGTNTQFTDTFRNNDRVIITNGVSNILANVAVIASDTQLYIDTTPTFSDSNCSIFLIESTPFGKVLKNDIASVSLTDVVVTGYEYSTALFGEQSFCTAGVSNTTPYITVNGRSDDEFNGFNQLITFVGTLISEEKFIEDETIVLETTESYAFDYLQPSMYFHSMIDNPGTANDQLFVTNLNNAFNIPDNGSITLRGTTSNAYFTASYKYNGEIIPDSGEVLYLENLSPIKRNPNQTETIKLILEF